MEQTRCIVDRIEGDTAVCRRGAERLELPLSMLCKDVREGDVLIGNADGTFFTTDAGETEKRKSRIQGRFDKIKEKQKKE